MNLTEQEAEVMHNMQRPPLTRNQKIVGWAVVITISLAIIVSFIILTAQPAKGQSEYRIPLAQIQRGAVSVGVLVDGAPVTTSTPESAK